MQSDFYVRSSDELANGLAALARFDEIVFTVARFCVRVDCHPAVPNEKENFKRRNPYQDLVDEQHLPLRDARRCNRRVEAITGGMIVGMTVYAWDDSCSKQAGANVVKISEANYRDNPDLCIKIIVEALVSLPAGFYTVVYNTDPLPCVMDFRIGGKGCKLKVRSFDRETINRIKLPAALRVVVV